MALEALFLGLGGGSQGHGVDGIQAAWVLPKVVMPALRLSLESTALSGARIVQWHLSSHEICKLLIGIGLFHYSGPKP